MLLSHDSGVALSGHLCVLSQVRCHDYVELLAELHLMPGFLSDHPRVHLLIIDSVASPFRPLFDELSQRTRLLSSLAQQLISMASSRDIAVVITNQMTTRVQGPHSEVVPALGDSWGHAAAIRLLLHWEGSQRLATIVKSPCHRVCTVTFKITSEGFRDAEHLDEPQHSRPQTHPAAETQTADWSQPVNQSEMSSVSNS